MLTEAILIGLAAWRVASFLVNEDGPFNVSHRLRVRIGWVYDEYGGISRPDTFLGGLFSCVWCMSVWTAIGFWVLWQVAPECVMVVAAMAVPPVVERIVKNG